MDEFDQGSTDNTLEMTADLVAAYVSNNNVPMSELPALIAKVHAALDGLGNSVAAEPVGPEKPTPAQIKKSITPDALISFEDGKPYKTMRRHLTMRGLTPEAYRAKYGLPADYPMTSAAYSAQRSALAHSLGLGQKRRKAAPEVEEAPEATPKPKDRKKVAETA
ncbi:MAG: MucR family transcriptional regulator [Alphaproteobacteria bacterium]|nr:MAG: MucR family transcriptional regulator [Alphaproteobacteria bacterium]